MSMGKASEGAHSGTVSEARSVLCVFRFAIVSKAWVCEVRHLLASTPGNQPRFAGGRRDRPADTGRKLDHQATSP
jgi:hypothetical protein